MNSVPDLAILINTKLLNVNNIYSKERKKQQLMIISANQLTHT